MLVKNHKCFDDQLDNDNTLLGALVRKGGFTLLSREHLVTEQRRGEHYNRSGRESPAGSGGTRSLLDPDCFTVTLQ